MHECAALGVWGEVTSGNVLETFNDGLQCQLARQLYDARGPVRKTDGLATAIMPNNNGQGRVELHNLDTLVVKRPDTPDGQLVQGGPVIQLCIVEIRWLLAVRTCWLRPLSEDEGSKQS